MDFGLMYLSLCGHEEASAKDEKWFLLSMCAHLGDIFECGI